MINLECRIGAMNTSIERFGALEGLADFIKQHFLHASHGDIDLVCSGPQYVTRPLPKGTSVSSLYLHNALAYLTENPIRGTISRIGVLLAESYSSFPPALGVMFDRGFTTVDDLNSVNIFTGVPREGCAIFLDTIFKLRNSTGQFLDEVFFTTIHELGHVFNLQHETRSLNFMTPSRQESAYGPSAFHFDPNQQKWLSQCSTNKMAMPGGSPFMEMGTYSNLNAPLNPSAPCAPFGLEIYIDCNPREFWQFEPIQLEIELRLVGGPTQSHEVPDELDPGYPRFRLMIEDSVGERKLYRSTKHFCSSGNVRKIEIGAPFRRDLPVFGQSGGYTFRRAGVHRLWVEFETKEGVIRSNTLDVNVKQEFPDDKDSRLHRSFLTNPFVANVLFYRDDLPHSNGIRSLIKYIDRFPEASSAAEIHYTLGLASISRALRMKKGGVKVKQEAAEHLKRAIDFELLGKHRREKSEYFLKAY